MNQFVAPQFIDVEDRIIGPITTRQFVMMVIGGVIVFLAYKLFDTASFALTALIVIGVVVLLGFVKINGRHFGPFVKSMIEAIRRPKIRVWQKYLGVASVSKKDPVKSNQVSLDLFPQEKTVVASRNLAELALLVDTGGKYQGQ